MDFCSWIRWACWIAVSRRRRSASDFGFILRLEREGESSGDEDFFNMDFGCVCGWGCGVDILAIFDEVSDVFMWCYDGE